MPEMTRVLQRDLEREWMPRRPRAGLAEQLADVAHLGRERLGVLVAQQPAELLQVRSAAGSVHDDEVDVAECDEQPSRERPALVEPVPWALIPVAMNVWRSCTGALLACFMIAVGWVLGGIAVSCLADIPIGIMEGGVVAVGRPFC